MYISVSLENLIRSRLAPEAPKGRTIRTESFGCGSGCASSSSGSSARTCGGCAGACEGSAAGA